MNTLTKSIPDLESLRKAIQTFRPNPYRVPFNNLKPFHDSIVELRGKQASYSVIAELLQQHGVKTSRARVAEYGRIVLEGGKSRKRRKQAKPMPVINASAAPQRAPAAATKSAPTTTPATVTSNVPPPAEESSPFRSSGPRIANVPMMSPAEAAELEAFLKSGSASKP
jgi:pyruvate/2-oxoglutarate dehydrogenase complex dihydrolipoamide acyltransferase (E2) component